ncbi:MAG: helix-turn-helix domain-containing protein [Thomasclavelia ramosa]
MSIKQLMIKKSISRYKLCKITGISSGGLTDVLNKKVKNPRIDTLIKIAEALELTNDEFAELCGYRKGMKMGYHNKIVLKNSDPTDIDTALFNHSGYMNF